MVKSIFETSPCAWTMSSLADEVGLCRTCSRCLISSWRSSSTVSNNSCPPCSTSTCPSSKPSDRTSRRSGLSLAGSSERAVSSARRAFWSSGFHSSLDLLVAISRNKENKRSRGCSEEKLQDGVDSDAGHQLTGAERLGDVVVSAQFQALHPVPLCRLCSEEDDRGRRKNRGLSDLSAQVKSVGARKHHIQKK